jgi:hypothetical protein
MSVVVTVPTYTIAITPASGGTPVKLVPGGSAAATVTVHPLSGFVGTVNLTGSGSPATMSISGLPASVSLDGTHDSVNSVTVGGVLQCLAR